MYDIIFWVVVMVQSRVSQHQDRLSLKRCQLSLAMTRHILYVQTEFLQQFFTAADFNTSAASHTDGPDIYFFKPIYQCNTPVLDMVAC